MEIDRINSIVFDLVSTMWTNPSLFPALENDLAIE